jgi:hypothetical protein
MARAMAFFLAAALVALSSPADAQSRRQDRLDRRDAARAQGIPPGQMPPAGECRVWYDNRSNGQQPSPTSCDRAEAIASRDRNARVVYGENVYRNGRSGYYGNDSDNDRAVRRGSVRDPRISGGVIDRDDRYDDRYGRDARNQGNPAFRNGYRDGLTKGREDAEDGDRYDVNRHSWYRSANRGYENELGTRYEYIDRYRRGFEAGYAEGYRVYDRR